MNHQKSNFRWVVVGLIFFLVMINYIDRSAIAFTIDKIAGEFHLSEHVIGIVLGAFGLGYALSTFLGGIAADHYGAKKVLSLSACLWGLATLLTGAANGFMILFLARVLLGLAEGPSFPGMTRALSDWLPDSERNRSLSFALIAVPLSLAISGPIVSHLMLLFSWRGTYFILSGIALLWMPIWWYLFNDKPSASCHVNQAELAYIQQESTIISKLSTHKNPWHVLLFNKTLVANNWAFFVFGFYLFFFMNWLPNYLKDIYHFDIARIGFYTTFPWLMAALMMWITGYLSDLIFKRTQSLRLSRSYPIFLSQLLAALCVIPIIYATNATFAIIFISLAVGFAMSANAAFYVVNVDIAKERAGTSLGIMDTLFAISGFLAPTIAGYLVSFTGHFEAVFWLLTALGLSSTLTTMLFHNR